MTTGIDTTLARLEARQEVKGGGSIDGVLAKLGAPATFGDCTEALEGIVTDFRAAKITGGVLHVAQDRAALHREQVRIFVDGGEIGSRPASCFMWLTRIRSDIEVLRLRGAAKEKKFKALRIIDEAMSRY